MEEEENTLPPFWLQSNDTLRRFEDRRRQRILRRSKSLFLNSGALVVVLLVTALVFIFIIIPSVLSFTSQVFRPHLVKKSWDSLNLVLVLFAIVCGFLSRNGNDDNANNNSSEDHRQSVCINNASAPESNPSTPRQWFDNRYSDRTAVMSRLRSSSSYPDLRHESDWASRDDRWRSYDDFHVNSYQIPSSSSGQELHHRRPWQPEPEPVVVPDSDFTEEVSSAPSPPPQPADSPPRPETPPKVGVKRKPRRSHEAIGENERISAGADSEAVDVEVLYPPPSPTPTPPPPPMDVYEVRAERNSRGKIEKRRGVVSKEFLMSSLRRKKKKQRQKSVENFDAIFTSSAHSSSSSSYSALQPPQPSRVPPPPPPPPPPPSVFHNLFTSKKGKSKKLIDSIPPPRKPSSTANASKTKPSNPIAAQRFPLAETASSTISTSIGTGGMDLYRGNESPLIPIPPPPPPPPFKMQGWKFVRHGDFIRINSNNSSRSGSPDLDDVVEDSGSADASPVARNGGAVMEVGESSSKAMFCPSPDVNSKADTFIQRFRAGLRLEKMNSVKERRSTLGPHASPN